mgnify:CR=1 FL=1|jgi:dinuclear metal center YbgI/SA1388 family protein|tara:strand:- start:105 stop:851 length:747 start_codon:yes stop_codon:yes gene_type:complete
MERDELKKYLDSFLRIKKFKGDRFNGLKVRGKTNIQKLGVATNCTFQVIDLAIKNKVDFLLVHHGGWKETDLELAKEKWQKLGKKDISLYIAHAPLDGKKEFGTSKILGDLIGLRQQGRFAFYKGDFAGVYGTIKPVSLSSLKRKLNKKLNTDALAYKNNSKKCRKLAIVAGGTGINSSHLKKAIQLGCDTYISGSSSIFPVIYAKERKLNLLLAGHTATERPAVQQFGKYLGEKFKIKTIQLREKLF